MDLKQGLEALRLYVESAGKYGPGTGAFLLPYYGVGELPQVQHTSRQRDVWPLRAGDTLL